MKSKFFPNFSLNIDLWSNFDLSYFLVKNKKLFCFSSFLFLPTRKYSFSSIMCVRCHLVLGPVQSRMHAFSIISVQFSLVSQPPVEPRPCRSPSKTSSLLLHRSHRSAFREMRSSRKVCIGDTRRKRDYSLRTKWLRAVCMASLSLGSHDQK